jgi:hypothetical protein
VRPSLLLVLACGCDLTEIHGSIALPDRVITPSSCWSGDTREFYGADLVDGPTTLRLFQDPVVGWLFTVTLAGDPSVPDVRLAPKVCTTFRASLSRDGCTRCTKNDNDEDDSTMSGSITIDCTWPGQGQVTGHVEFQYCDNPEEDR